MVSPTGVPLNGGIDTATYPTALPAAGPTPAPAGPAKKPVIAGKTAAFSRWKKLTGTAMFINRLGKTGWSLSYF